MRHATRTRGDRVASGATPSARVEKPNPSCIFANRTPNGNAEPGNNHSSRSPNRCRGDLLPLENVALNCNPRLKGVRAPVKYRPLGTDSTHTEQTPPGMPERTVKQRL